YVLFKAFKKLTLPDEPNDFGGIEVLWTGTYFHLWFMPFILMVTLSAFAIGKCTAKHVNIQLLLSSTILAVGIIIASMDPPTWIAGNPDFNLLAWDALPAVCWGLAIALIYRDGLDHFISNRATSLVCAFVFTFLMAWLMVSGRNTLVENA